MRPDDVNLPRRSFFAFSAERRATLVLALIATLAGCAESTSDPHDAAPQDSGPPDVTTDSGDATHSDAGPDTASHDAYTADVPEDATYIQYERDVRPLLEASACGDCHAGVIVMDYSWISAPGETWCSGPRYDRRWHCFEEHARTQIPGTEGSESCDTEFYHRHGEPCLEEETRLRVLEWAADGYRE